MARKRHTPDQIISKLRDIEVLIAEGTGIARGFEADGNLGANFSPLA